VADLPAELAQQELPPELLADTTALLRAVRPEFALWMDRPDGPQDKFAVGAIVAGAATLAAVVQRKEDGTWSFLFEHKPADNELMQHVLEALDGYLALLRRCWEDRRFGEAWNFDPEDRDSRSVEWVVRRFAESWGEGSSWESVPGPHPHETGLLRLDCSKTTERLGWRPAMDLDTAIDWTADWYRRHLSGGSAAELCCEQIGEYLALREGD